MIKAYYVQIIDSNGRMFAQGFLGDDDGRFTALPGVSPTSGQTFAASDLPADVCVRVSASQRGTVVPEGKQREAAEVAERFGYQICEVAQPKS